MTIFFSTWLNICQLKIASLWQSLESMRGSVFCMEPTGDKYFIRHINQLSHFHILNCRERLVMTECYYLRAKPLKKFFSQYMNPSTIIVCDVSHCYWLRARTLTKCIIQMPNLEELYIHDTKMTLKKMPKIFQACQKIVKLSLTLKEDNLKQFQESVIGKEPMKWMKKGFAKITHLKLFTFVVPYAEKWRAAIGVLK